jgi:serine protease AprX
MDIGRKLFTMSGTSQAAAVTTGVVALMLEADPTLTPDTVKCRLLASTRPAVTAEGKLAYSIFQQGAGLINALAAVNSSAVGCANRGLDLNADLNGTAHFGGSANVDSNGNYVVMDLEGAAWGSTLDADGYTWSRGFTWSKGYTWSQGYTWSKGFTWSKGYTWSQGFTWSKGFTCSKGYTWSRSLSWWDSFGGQWGSTRSASIATWVPNE